MVDDDLDDDGVANEADNCPALANPDQANRRRQVEDLVDQQKKFRLPTGCTFDLANNRLIICDTQRGRLQVYNKDNSYMDPQFNL